jgi:hypothetical protein
MLLTKQVGTNALLRPSILSDLLPLILLLVLVIFGVHTWNTPFFLIDTIYGGSVKGSWKISVRIAPGSRAMRKLSYIRARRLDRFPIAENPDVGGDPTSNLRMVALVSLGQLSDASHLAAGTHTGSLDFLTTASSARNQLREFCRRSFRSPAPKDTPLPNRKWPRAAILILVQVAFLPQRRLGSPPVCCRLRPFRPCRLRGLRHEPPSRETAQ